MRPDDQGMSFVLLIARRVQDSVPQHIPQAEKDLLVCYLAITQFRDLLSGPDADLLDQIDDKFIQEVLLPDLNRIILALREYRGSDPARVREAGQIMVEVLEKLYTARAAYEMEAPRQSAQIRVQALLYCRDRLQNAYMRLESLYEIRRVLSYMREIKAEPAAPRPASPLESFREFLSRLRGREGEANTDSPPPKKGSSRGSGAKTGSKPTLDLPPSPVGGNYAEGTPPQEVWFTAFHPRMGAVNTWHTLLVYAHLASALEKVRRDKERFKDELPMPKEVQSSFSAPIAPGTEITVVPHCEGVTFNPPRAAVRWLEDVHRLEFRLRADPSLLDKAPALSITIFVGPLIVGTLESVMFFTDRVETDIHVEEAHARMYHMDRIFVSYSHKDTEVALAFKKVHEATGHDVLIDIDDLRSGQEWNPELLRLIDRADIFQLFWSQNSCVSPYCRQEWQHALKRDREGFIRPVFWRQPLPDPPEELSKYHFEYVEL